jgi:hypothetical protein
MKNEIIYVVYSHSRAQLGRQREGEIDWEREAHYDELEWNAVSTWAKIKRWVRWQYNRFELWRTKDEIPF